MPEIQLLDGKKIPFVKSISGFELTKKISKSLEKSALIMEVDGELKDLSHEIKKDSKVSEIYNTNEISERHRHRYEVDLSLTKDFENKGFVFSGMSPDNVLPEVLESVNHKWFIGVQFHPELKSRPLEPHPLFSSFIKHCIK